MKISTKKIDARGLKEWLILLDGKTIAMAFTKKDAKFVAKCIRKYKK